MIAEYNVNLENKTKSELILFIKKLQDMLKEKEAEIEKYKKLLADNLAKGLNDSIKAKSKAENDLYDFAEGVQEDLDTKDKIINLMAERINWLCKTNGILLDKEHGENFDKEDIKQWFERKATNDAKDRYFRKGKLKLREIKFRGRSIKTKEWVYGYYWTNENGNHFIRQTVDLKDCFTIADIEVIPETVGQYTGLKDKNGREIYERRYSYR